MSNSPLRRSGIGLRHVPTRDHTALLATHTFIHMWYEPYLPVLPRRRASAPFGRYSFYRPIWRRSSRHVNKS